MQGKTVAGFDKLVNFTEVIVSTGYDASATSVVLQAGEGVKLPEPSVYGSYYGIWHDVTAQTLASGDANREWILINSLSSDTLTSITRAQQETSASTKNEVGHQYRISIVLSAAQMEKYNNLQNAGISRQAVVNSNFNVWGVGTSFADPVNNSTTADKWKAGFVLATGTFPTVVHSRQDLTPGDVLGSFYNYRINTNGVGTSLAATENYKLYQDVVNGTRFLAGASKKITVSFYAKSSIASKKIGVNVIQNYGTGGSPTSEETITGDNITLTSSWAFYSFTYTLNTLVGKTFGTNNDDYLRLQLWTMWQSGTQADVGASSAESFGGSGNVEFAQVQVCSGDVALEYKAKSSAYEYQEMYGVSLFDGSDVSTHYHSTDRARANHTGTQASTTLLESITLGEVLAANDYICISSADNKAYKATNATENGSKVIGRIVTGGAANATGTFVYLNGVFITTGLTADATYYLGTGGVLTTTKPAMNSSSVVPIVVGRAASTTRLVYGVQRLQRRLFTNFTPTGTSGAITVGFPISHVYSQHLGYDGTVSRQFASGYYDAIAGTQWSQRGSGSLIDSFVGVGTTYTTYTASVVANNLLLTWAGNSVTGTQNVILEIFEAL